MIVDDEPPSPRKRQRSLVQPTKPSPLDREAAFRGLSPSKDPMQPFASADEMLAEFSRPITTTTKSPYFTQTTIKKTLPQPRVDLASVILPGGETKWDIGMMVQDGVLILASQADRRKIRREQVGEVQVPPPQIQFFAG